MLVSFATARFAQNGFHPTSVSDIVNGVGVGKGVFYWYFESKDQLLIEILRQGFRDLRATQAKAVSVFDNPLEQLEAGIRATINWSAANADIMRLAQFGWTEDAFAGVLRRGHDRLVADLADTIGCAMATGQIAPGDPKVMALAIRSIVDRLAQEYRGEGDVDSIIVDTAIRMCLRGLQG
jgi:AcrR family transcriptional regulator